MMREPYPATLKDDRWKVLASLLPAARPGGRPRAVDMEYIVFSRSGPGREGAYCRGSGSRKWAGSLGRVGQVWAADFPVQRRRVLSSI